MEDCMKQKKGYRRLLDAFVMVIALSATAHAVTWSEWTMERIKEAEAMAVAKKVADCRALKTRADGKMEDLKISWETIGPLPRTKEAALTAKDAMADFMGHCEWDEDILPLYRALKDFISQLP
jgi:hypothetical protein